MPTTKTPAPQQPADKPKTGPKTEIGKARSSRNGLKHGILSKHILIEGERVQDYNYLLNGLMEAHQPQGMAEQILVEKMAVATWKMQRLNRIETADINKILADTKNPRSMYPPAFAKAPLNNADPFRHAMPADLNNILRYQTQLETQFYRALLALQQLQANRKTIIEAVLVEEKASKVAD